MFLDHFPGNRRRRRARSHQPQKCPHGTFRGAQRDPRRTKRRVSLQIPCRRFLNIPIFPRGQFWAENRTINEGYCGAENPPGPGLGAGIPRPPADPPKNHLYFSNRARPSPTRSLTFLNLLENIETYSGHFAELHNIFATIFENRF